MSEMKQTKSGRLGSKITPRWYMNLDAERKPLVGSALVLFGVVGGLVLAWHYSRVAAGLQHDINALLEGSRSVSTARLNVLTSEYHSAIVSTRIALVFATLWGFLAATGTTYFVTAMNSDLVIQLIQFTREAAGGDLSREVVRDDNSEIGDIQEALGKLLASFRATIARIDLAAGELKDAAAEMAHTSDESGHAIGEVAQSVSAISEGAAHQVELVTRTSDVVGGIEQSVRETATHAGNAQRQSADTEALTEEGVRRATEVQEAMQSVRETSLATAEMVRSLGDKSTNIDLIVQSITDIAAQTNLLALNAAIEAARAGEQGRGFAVVAEEVRKLAEDAQESAGDIAQLVGEIREQTTQAVVAMEAGVETVESGFDTVNRNRQIFFDISGAVRALHESSAEISGLANGIADSAGDVRSQIEEVASVAEESSASTEQVSASTEQTSAASQEVSASAHRVAQTAVNLASLASRFKLTATASSPGAIELSDRAKTTGPALVGIATESDEQSSGVNAA
jgi:methyl-accepting chemotaxis protein